MPMPNPTRTHANQLGLALFLGVLVGCSSERELRPKYSAPLVQLQKLQPKLPRLHTEEIRYRESDHRLFQCGFNFGIIDASDPAKMYYLADGLRHNVPG